MSVESNKRLVSLDALRGFDMFWIIGGAGFLVALIEVLGFPESWVEALAMQFTHVEWEGFHFYDLLFPLFVFVSGVTVPYSVLSRKAKGVPVSKLQITIIRRSFIIVLIGFSFSVFKFEWELLRLSRTAATAAGRALSPKCNHCALLNNNTTRDYIPPG